RRCCRRVACTVSTARFVGVFRWSLRDVLLRLGYRYRQGLACDLLVADNRAQRDPPWVRIVVASVNPSWGHRGERDGAAGVQRSLPEADGSADERSWRYDGDGAISGGWDLPADAVALAARGREGQSGGDVRKEARNAQGVPSPPPVGADG